MQDEELLDSFIAKANDATTPDLPIEQSVQKTDEDIVDSKARQGRQSASVLQKRTTIGETQLEKRIAATFRKYPDIAETALRQDLADQLEANNDEDVTEEQYAKIVNGHVKQSEQEKQDQQPQGPLISPPPFASATVQAVQDKVTKAADRASALSTPGGVGIMVAALLFFIWVIVPVSNGKTRMQLLWAVLTNQAYFPDDTSGSSGYFGDGGPDVPVPTTTTSNGTTLTPLSGIYIPDFEQDEW